MHVDSGDRFVTCVYSNSRWCSCMHVDSGDRSKTPVHVKFRWYNLVHVDSGDRLVILVFSIWRVCSCVHGISGDRSRTSMLCDMSSDVSVGIDGTLVMMLNARSRILSDGSGGTLLIPFNGILSDVSCLHVRSGDTSAICVRMLVVDVSNDFRFV